MCFLGLFREEQPAIRQILRMVFGAWGRFSKTLTCSAPRRLYLVDSEKACFRQKLFENEPLECH